MRSKEDWCAGLQPGISVTGLIRCFRKRRSLHSAFNTTPRSSRLAPHLLCLCLLLLGACSKAPAILHLTGPTMGTSYSVKINPGDDLPSGGELSAGIEVILEDVNRSMSTYIEDSELSRLNRHPGTGWIEISPALYEVLSTAQEISGRTGGAFDVTVGALVNLWGFGPEFSSGDLPADADIEAALAAAGYQGLALRADPPSLRKAAPAVYLDLSGIAKGYAVDRIAIFLETRGIGDYLVEIGGEVRARGVNGAGETWRVGIERPAADRRAILQVIELKDAAMATSGDYRNYYMHGGRRYSHTIDPRTGRPVTHKLSSVTVLDGSAMTADALATALLVMGPEAGPRYAEKTGLPALFILGEGEAFAEKSTAALQPYLAE